MFWMLKNSSGKKDAVLTMAVVGFVVVLAKVLIAKMSVTLGARTVELGSIDGSTIAAVLTPTLGAYVGRRYTDKKYGSDPAPPAPDGDGK